MTIPRFSSLNSAIMTRIRRRRLFGRGCTEMTGCLYYRICIE